MEFNTTILNFFEGGTLRNFVELIELHKKSDTGEKIRETINKVIESEIITEEERRDFKRIKMVLDKLPDRLIEEAVQVYGEA